MPDQSFGKGEVESSILSGSTIFSNKINDARPDEGSALGFTETSPGSLNPSGGSGEPEFAEDFTALRWRYEEHWSGETARFDVCGLHAWVRDLDGDATVWEIRKGRRGPILAEGSTHEGIHFFECLRSCEQALRRIVAERIAELRARPAPFPPLLGGNSFERAPHTG